MPEVVIRHGRIEPDEWTFVSLAGGEPPAFAVLPRGPIVLPLALWKARREEMLGRGTPVGVCLETSDDAGALAADAGRLALVAIHFPKFADGRGYSIAHLLRTRHGFRGELRATGDVGRDQVFYLARSGFDAFQPKAGRDPAGLVAALRDFGVTYQSAADGRAPLFRRREGTLA